MENSNLSENRLSFEIFNLIYFRYIGRDELLTQRKMIADSGAIS